MSDFNAPWFNDTDAAREHLEAVRWPDGPNCPFCGNVKRLGRLEGKSHRPGLWKCYECRKPFTVTVGTVFERSHIPLHVWFRATYLLCSSKKGVSAHQLHRMLGVTYKTAWFMAHRIREAMRADDLAAPFGAGGGAVEADETFIGHQKGKPRKRAFHHKMKVLALVDRDVRKVRSMAVDNLKAATVAPIIRQNLAR